VKSQNKVKSYKDLKFWKTAFEVTILVVELTRKLPKEASKRKSILDY